MKVASDIQREIAFRRYHGLKFHIIDWQLYTLKQYSCIISSIISISISSRSSSSNSSSSSSSSSNSSSSIHIIITINVVIVVIHVLSN